MHMIEDFAVLQFISFYYISASCDVYTILDTDEELSSPSSLPESITSVQSVRAVEEHNTNNTEQSMSEKW